MDEFNRGENITLTKVMYDDDGTTALDAGDFTAIRVKIYHKHLRTELARYTLDDNVAEDGTSGIVVIIPAATTATATLGVYEYHIRTSETNSDYESNVRTRKYVADAFYLTKAIT